MSTQLMPPPADLREQPQPAAQRTPQQANRRGEPSVEEIIAAARAKPERPRFRRAWLLAGLTGLLFWASFTPLDWGPVGWIALAPLLLLVRMPQRTRLMYTAIYVTAFVQTLAVYQWMRLGDPSMYMAWLAWSVYAAMYFPAFVAISRLAVHRLRAPLVLAVPAVWVALEFLRAHLMTGWAWYFLGHTQYRWLEVIQISDMTGAYGVSFLLAMTAACLAYVLPESLLRTVRLAPPAACGSLPASVARRSVAVAACLAVFAAVLSYGYVRRSQADFRAGPRVALVQGNVPISMKRKDSERLNILQLHRSLTGAAVRYRPDLIVWPETMYRAALLELPAGMTDETLAQATGGDPAEIRRHARLVPELLTEQAREAGTAMIIGLERHAVTPRGVQRFNSAAFVSPHAGVAARYDKLHRVPFGEYLPLREQFPWLVNFTPFSPDFGIEAGERAALFQHKDWTFSPIICFEDTVPHLVRNIVKSTAGVTEDGEPVDCLVNLTNDGWFQGSSELDQHLITAAFRAVECRTPMVRAVNTGISAVIDGDGAIVEPEVFWDHKAREESTLHDPASGRWRKSLDAVVVHDVPLDDRRSLYVAWGDWFAWGCALATIAFPGLAVLLRRREATSGRRLFVETVSQPV